MQGYHVIWTSVLRMSCCPPVCSPTWLSVGWWLSLIGWLVGWLVDSRTVLACGAVGCTVASTC
jgi:hypothetical protein